MPGLKKAKPYEIVRKKKKLYADMSSLSLILSHKKKAVSVLTLFSGPRIVNQGHLKQALHYIFCTVVSQYLSRVNNVSILLKNPTL